MTHPIHSFFLCLLATCSAPLSPAAQVPLLNEIVSKNETGLQDSDGDEPDWIELYNPHSESIDLLGYTLSDDDDDEAPWALPHIMLPPGGYTVIFASGKDRPDAAEPHTNFKVSSEGEWVYLYAPNGVLADQVAVPELPQDRAYGRMPDGGETWSILDLPSPWGSNDGSNHLGFSRPSGFYAEPFDLSVSSLTGDSVFFTLDGSVPTPASALYTGPIVVTDRSDEPNVLSEIPTTVDSQYILYYPSWKPPTETVAKATVLRVASYRDGHQTSAVSSRTYFVGSTVDHYTMPVVSLVTDPVNFFDPDSGIYIPGNHFDPNDPNYPQHTGNNFQRGKDWERDVNITYFTEGGATGFSQDAGIRIHGGTSRQTAQKSLRLYARKKYGAQYFEYPLMPHRNLQRYKRFLLRAVMGSWEGETLMTDDFAQTASFTLNLDCQDSKPVIVFLNGEYWGIHVIKDRLDERYAAYISNNDPDSVLYFKGFVSEHNTVTNFGRYHDLSVAANYDSIAGMMDIGGYIDYQIAQQFFRNIDWPANNIATWKKDAPDGKLRWVFFDLDVSFGDAGYNMLEHNTLDDPTVSYPNPPVSTVLFRSLLENDAFRERFIQRYAEILNTTFRVDQTLTVFNQIKSDYAPEVSEHIARWQYPRSYEGWDSDTEDLARFVEDRPCYSERHITDFFGLSDFGFSCSGTPNGQMGVALGPNPNHGSFNLYNTTDQDWQNLSVRVYDIEGRTLFQRQGLELPGSGNLRLQIDSPAKGLYVAEVRSNHGTYRLKFVVAE